MATFNTMGQQQRDLVALVATEDEVTARNEAYRHKTTALRHENRRLLDCVKRMRRNRELRIMQHVDGQARELAYERHMRLAEVEATYKENERLRRGFEAERRAQLKMLAELGQDTVEGAFAMYPDVWESLEDRMDRRHYN